MEKKYVVREFLENDDFDYFDELVFSEHNKRRERVGIKMKGTYSLVNKVKVVNKEDYYPENETQSLINEQTKGFVLEVDGEIAAFVRIARQQSGNGYLHMEGIVTVSRHPSGKELEPLIEACVDFIRNNGGKKLFCFSEILPGQIHNQEFDFWEKYNFKPEPYYSQWAVCHDFTKWETPEDLDIDNITPADEIDLAEIATILKEDGEDFIAESLRYDFKELSPVHVFLKLYDPDNGQINGIAYYQVNRHQDDLLGTNTLGIHIRPHLNDQSSYAEIQRFVRCVLASMKQLNLAYAATRMSSRNLLSMIALGAEGFLLAPMGQVVLYRSL